MTNCPIFLKLGFLDAEKVLNVLLCCVVCSVEAGMTYQPMLGSVLIPKLMFEGCVCQIFIGFYLSERYLTLCECIFCCTPNL